MDVPSTSMDPDILLKNEDASKCCPVCSEKSDGVHFGIECCRACAAFFRRSVALTKKYTCRAGGSNCMIHKSVRAMCKKCRLKCCYERGMLAENVKHRRDPIGPKKADTPVQVQSPIANVSSSEIEQILSPLPSTSAPTPNTSNEPPELLMKIFNNYSTMCAVRRATELMITNSTATSLHNFLSRVDTCLWMEPWNLCSRNKFRTCRKVFRPAVHSTQSQLSKVFLPTIAEFVANCFPEYETFEKHEKWVMFRNFFLVMLIFDSAYRTAKIWTKETVGEKFYISMTTYLDSDNVENYLSDKVQNRAELTRLLRTAVATGPRTKLARQLFESKLSDEEFAALLALTMWQSNLEDATERLELLAHEKRLEIYRQLHLYYTSQGNKAYAVRMGEVLNYQSIIFACNSHFRENMELCNLYHEIQDVPIFQIVRNQMPEDF